MSKLASIVHLLKMGILVIFLSLFVGVTSRENIKIENNNLNKNLDLVAMAKIADETGRNALFTPIDSYFGDMTAYTADCPLCSGRLACAPNYDVLNGVSTYPDDVYGTVNIVASSTMLPCGSIVKINVPTLEQESIMAIVLDRGVGGRTLDLLTNSEEQAYSIGRRSVSYDILREGW